MLRCALTGQIPKEPVLTPQGVVFEKEAIRAHLQSSNLCPVKNVPLRFEDLIDIEVSQPTVRPTAVRAASFSDYLSGLANEWNTAQTELYETRKQLAQCQRELAQALYEREAAKRVIARLISEGSVTIVRPEVSVPPPFDFGAFISDANEEKLHKINFPGKFSTYLSPQSKSTVAAFDGSSVYPSKDLATDSPYTVVSSKAYPILLMGTETGRIMVYDIRQGSCIEQIQLGSSRVVSIRNTSDNGYIAADEHNVAIFDDFKSNTPSHKITTDRVIVDVFLHWKGEHIVVVYKDGYSVFTVNGNEERSVGLAEGFIIKAADLHCGGQFLVTAIEETDTFLIWDIAKDNSEPTKALHIEEDDKINTAKFSSNGINLLVTGEKHCYIYSTEGSEEGFNGELQRVMTEQGAQNAAWHDNGLVFATTNENKLTIGLITSENGSDVESAKEFELTDVPVSFDLGGNAAFIAAVGPQNVLTFIK